MHIRLIVITSYLTYARENIFDLQLGPGLSHIIYKKL